MLTNWSTVQERVSYLKELDAKEENNEFDLLPKKEAALLRREHDKLRQNLGGLKKVLQMHTIIILKQQKLSPYILKL